MTRKYDIDKLAELYFEHSWTLTQLASRYGGSPATVGTALKAAGHTLRPRGPKPMLGGYRNRKERDYALVTMYRKGATQMAVGEAFGLTHGRVAQILVEDLNRRKQNA